MKEARPEKGAWAIFALLFLFMMIDYAAGAVAPAEGLIGLIFLRPEDQRARFAGYGTAAQPAR